MLIVGASVRAAVESATRGGIEVTGAADLFGDRDLKPVTRHWMQVEPRYRNLVDIIAEHTRKSSTTSGSSQACHWMYTGALENYPRLIEQLARRSALLGNSAADLRRLRNPWWLSELFRQSEIPFPDLAADALDIARATRGWLKKPVLSCAGHGVENWQPPDSVDTHSIDRLLRSYVPEKSAWDEAISTTIPVPRFEHDESYLQSHVNGRSVSATFVAASGRVRLLGAFEQFNGGVHATTTFGYAGSIGPTVLTPKQTEQWQRIGDTLIRGTNLVGVFGVDAIDTGSSIVPIEVNPRLPASAELIDWQHQTSIVGHHCAACVDGVLPERLEEQDGTTCVKLVVFADRTGTVDVNTSRWIDRYRAWDANIRLADLPETGTEVEVGDPILTVLVREESRQQAIDTATAFATKVRERVGQS